jgi:uncharacterized membrane protein YpjA
MLFKHGYLNKVRASNQDRSNKIVACFFMICLIAFEMWIVESSIVKVTQKYYVHLNHFIIHHFSTKVAALCSNRYFRRLYESNHCRETIRSQGNCQSVWRNG